MTDKQPEALRLADLINERPDAPLVVKAAAAELRRLHEVNQELLEALKIIAGDKPCIDSCLGNVDIARAAIARAEGGA